MAFMDQEKKAKIAVELKKVMPKGWKWSLSVNHYSTIVLTISAGPEVLAITPSTGKAEPHRTIGEYYIEEQFTCPKIAATFKKILEALNLNNFDKSDSMTDYFHVGHYVDINIGKWNKPYKVI